MATDPLVLLLDGVTLPGPPEGVDCVDVQDAEEVIAAAAEARWPLVVGPAAALAALPPGTPALQVVACEAPGEILGGDVIGAVPLWDADAAGLAIAAALATRQRLLDAKEETTRAGDALQAFVHAVGHDLKAPLQGIIGLAGLLMEQAGVRVFPEVASFAERIESDADRLAGMITALTAYARLGRPSVVSEVVALGPIVDEVCAAAIRRHTERFPRLQVAPELPCVQGDTELLSVAIAALIHNAIVFSDTSPPMVEVGWSAGPDQTVTMTIEDTGIGVAPHALESVFEMFTRLDKRRGDGLGVGLTMARRAAELMGGTLTLTSAPDEGTTAHLTLPAG
jgi:signal transduction histidine kinase